MYTDYKEISYLCDAVQIAKSRGVKSFESFRSLVLSHQIRLVQCGADTGAAILASVKHGCPDFIPIILSLAVYGRAADPSRPIEGSILRPHPSHDQVKYEPFRLLYADTDRAFLLALENGDVHSLNELVKGVSSEIIPRPRSHTLVFARAHESLHRSPEFSAAIENAVTQKVFTAPQFKIADLVTYMRTQASYRHRASPASIDPQHTPIEDVIERCYAPTATEATPAARPIASDIKVSATLPADRTTGLEL